MWFRYILIVLVFLLSGCELSDPNSKEIKPTPLVPLKHAAKAEELWSTHAVKSVDKLAVNLSLAGNNGRVFAADSSGHVVAVAFKDGNEAWKTSLSSPIIAGPVAGEGKVIVATEDARLIALDENNGKILWRSTLPNQAWAQPLIADSKVFVKTIDGKLLAIGSYNGQEIWRYDHGAPLMVLHGGSAPRIAGDKVIVGFSDGKLAAIKRENGHLIWETTTSLPNGFSEVERMSDIGGTPIIIDGVIYVASFQGNLSAFNLENGNLLWQQPASTGRNLAISNAKLFLIDNQSAVLAFRRNGGDKIWTQSQLQGRNLTSPAVMNSSIVVGDEEGYVHWLSQNDGSFVARTRADKSGITVTPLVFGNRLFVLTNKGNLVSYRIMN